MEGIRSKLSLINRAGFIIALVLIGSSVFSQTGGRSGTFNSASSGKKPNIIVFLVDDMGIMDTSLPMLTDGFGNPQEYPLNRWYKTPNIERLADRGIRFTHFYSHLVCSPSRVSIMTGQNSARHHVTDAILPDSRRTGDHIPAWRREGLTHEDVTLPGILREVGYRTIHVGKGHFGPVGSIGAEPLNLGFDVNIAGCSYGQPGSYFGEDGYGNLNPERKFRAIPDLEKYHRSDTFLTEALTIEAKAAMDEALKDETPFYLYFSHYGVHAPFDEDKRFIEDYRNQGRSSPEEAFAALIEGVDKSLGDVMDHLEVRGVDEETVLFFLSDNGSASPVGGEGEIGSTTPLRGKKGNQWEGGTRVPFLAAWLKPNADNPVQQKLPIAVGEIQKQIGACYDLFPTIAELTGASIPEDHVLDGQNLKVLLRGQPDPRRRNIFLSHFPHDRRDRHYTTWLSGDWKLIYHYLPTPDQPRYRLFNLRTDPSESQEISAQHPERLSVMVQAMVAELETMGALYPIVNGEALKPVVP